MQSTFDSEVKEIHSRIEQRLDDYSNLLKGTVGLFAASVSVERQEFRAYIEKLHLEQTYPGIQGVGFAQLIPASEKQRMITTIRREGFAQFDIKPTGVRDPYSAIVYLEPFDWRNQRAFGYDMYSEPIRRMAMEMARDTDSPAISGKVVLVQETSADVQNGFLMYVPVYRNKLPHNTLKERRHNLAGWVYEPFRVNDLMDKGVLGKFLVTIQGELDIEIYDGDSMTPQGLMFDSSHTLHTSALGSHARFSSIRSAQYFGRNWIIAVHSLPSFEAKVKHGQSLPVAIGGSAISLLLTLVTWLLATTNARAIKLAEKMSARLESTLTQTIGAMSTIVEMRDLYTAGHQRQAAELARAIALEIGLSTEQVQAVYRAALIYEIGKIQIPSEILSKPGKLDVIEFSMIKTHAQAGFDILQGIDFPWPIAQIVQQHHERLDGSGYPQGLKGADILLEARIIAVADVVEAICSHRPYRPALGIEAALDEIAGGRGIRYDPAVADACIRLFRERGYQFPGH